MQELKVFYSPDGEHTKSYYLKSEADAILSGKDKTIAELETNLSEIQSQKMQLEDDVALLRRNNAELKEAQRWRKYSEEKPSSDGYYIICGASGFRNADRFMECKDGRGMDFSFYSYGVEYWMPMPPAPKEAK